MSKQFRPMLAATAETENDIKFPCGITTKIDGIRSTNFAATLYSRKFIEIPNGHTQSMFGLADFDGFDGELAVGPPTSPTLMQDTMSGVMSSGGEPEVDFHVFDDVRLPGESYLHRMEVLSKRIHHQQMLGMMGLHFVEPTICTNLEEFRAIEELYVEAGFEGVITRAIKCTYKNGRSTLREQGMLKFKRFEDAEATILGFIEGETNTNEKVKDELGYAKRSTAKAGMVKTGKLGSFLMRDIITGVEFQCGTGRRSAAEKAKIYAHPEQYIGKLAVYKHFPIGVKDKPRFPQFKCLRHPDDMS